MVPGLYATSDELLEKLNRFVEVGGHVLFSLRSGFCDENIKVRAVEQPGIIGKACGVYYNQFVNARGLKLKDHGFELDDESQRIYNWMELLIPQEGTEVLAVYDHCYWGEYAAITRNTYGRGSATYVGCIPSDAFMLKLVKKVAEQAGLFEAHERLEFPLITRKGTNDAGRRVHFYFNYSNTQQEFTYQFSDAEDLSQGIFIKKGDRIVVKPWDFVIIEE